MEMKPEVKKINAAQILITVTLIGILMSLLGLYIYYGMYQARQTVQIEEVVVPAAELDPDEARRKEIIEALNNQPSTVNELEKRVIINSLKQSPVEVDSKESENERTEIINALQQNQ